MSYFLYLCEYSRNFPDGYVEFPYEQVYYVEKVAIISYSKYENATNITVPKNPYNRNFL